mmetsp:Transcript_22242/g.33624  ORF Transcript_22242/g.33624 Transcript_22242/m.33624 type:complete len:833 (-) Transcript_22242:391-2889(-)
MRNVVTLLSVTMVSAVIDRLGEINFNRSQFVTSLTEAISGREHIKENKLIRSKIHNRHRESPLDRNVTSNIFARPSVSPVPPSSLPSSSPSITPSSLPSLQILSETPSYSGTPSLIPSQTLSSNPTKRERVPINLPPINIFPSTTFPPTNGFETQPPTLSPIMAPQQIGTPIPTVFSGEFISPAMSIPQGSMAPIIQWTSIEEYLTETLTDDGLLQQIGTPQNLAYTRLMATNPGLDPNTLQGQIDISQRYSLNSIYYSTSGPSMWFSRENWLSVESPCGWFGVTCDSNGFVVEFSLRENDLFGTLPSEIRGLSALRVLDLGDNFSIYGRIPQSIGQLTKLRSIILDANSLGAELDNSGTPVSLVSNAVPEEIMNLENLVTLNLETNFFGGQLAFNLISPLTNLESLNLRLNYFTGAIPSNVGELPKSLLILDLSGNTLTGTLPTEFGLLTQLQELRVAQSDASAVPKGTCIDANSNPKGCITGTIPSQLGFLTNLKVLWLFENHLQGVLPTELGNILTLRELMLFTNSLSGEIPASVTGLQNLEIVDLSTNYLGPALPLPFFQKPSLEVLSLGINIFADQFPTTFNLPKIRTISLHQSINVTGSLPNTIAQLTTLNSLDLYSCSLASTIPTEIGNLTALEAFDAEFNFLTGSIPLELSRVESLESLNLNYNFLSGTVPGEFAFLQRLTFLDLGFNYLTGSVPPELGFLLQLEVLNLGDNSLQGRIPNDFLGLSSIRKMRFERNRLTGTIPKQLGSLEKLEEITFLNNTVTGTIPPELGNLELLTSLDLAYNLLTGNVPESFAQLTSLSECMDMFQIFIFQRSAYHSDNFES